MAIFHENTGKPVPECHHSGFDCKDDGDGGDNWSTCQIGIAKQMNFTFPRVNFDYVTSSNAFNCTNKFF